VTNDLYLSPVPESRAELFPWQSTEGGAVPGLDLAGTVVVGTGVAGEARFDGLTEVQTVSPPCTEIPARVGDEPERTAARDTFPEVTLFIAVRGAPWICSGAPTRTGLDVRS
jgi:hypothetical protein